MAWRAAWLEACGQDIAGQLWTQQNLRVCRRHFEPHWLDEKSHVIYHPSHIPKVDDKELVEVKPPLFKKLDDFIENEDSDDEQLTITREEAAILREALGQAAG